MLDTFITSRVRRKIVIIYSKFPDYSNSIRGLSRLLKEDAANVCRELDKLEKIGFLIGSKSRNTKVYRTNRHFPLLKELQSIVLKSQRYRQQAWSLKASKTTNSATSK